MSEILKKTSETIKDAMKQQETELKRLYPVGSVICFRIRHGQKNLSTGVVLERGYTANIFGGSLFVRHEQAKEGSRVKYRHVSVRDVILLTELNGTHHD